MRDAWTKFSVLLATFFGVGFIPGGPGTYAAILSLPFIWWMTEWDFLYRALAFTIVTVLSVFWSEAAGIYFKESDSRKIVIDEVVGVWLALLFVSEPNIAIFIIGLVAFRFFDIVKPGPVRWADENIKGGLGVVVDDLIAGVLAALVVFGFQQIL